MTEQEHREASHKAALERQKEMKRWHGVKRGDVWDAMRELEERISILEADYQALKGAKK